MRVLANSPTTHTFNAAPIPFPNISPPSGHRHNHYHWEHQVDGRLPRNAPQHDERRLAHHQGQLRRQLLLCSHKPPIKPHRRPRAPPRANAGARAAVPLDVSDDRSHRPEFPKQSVARAGGAEPPLRLLHLLGHTRRSVLRPVRGVQQRRPEKGLFRRRESATRHLVRGGINSVGRVHEFNTSSQYCLHEHGYACHAPLHRHSGTMVFTSTTMSILAIHVPPCKLCPACPRYLRSLRIPSLRRSTSILLYTAIFANMVRTHGSHTRVY